MPSMDDAAPGECRARGGGVVSAKTTQPPPPSRAQKALDKFHEEGAIGKAYDARLLRRLWPFVRPHARFLAAIARHARRHRRDQPHAAPRHGRRRAPGRCAAIRDRLMRDGLTLAGLLIVQQALTFVQMYAMQIAGARAMADLRTAIFQFFQRLRLRYYDRTRWAGWSRGRPTTSTP